MSYAAVAHAVGVSRTWLYRQDPIRDVISQLRRHEPPAAAQRASSDSLRQRLDTARAETTRLRAENRSLRDQLARHRMQHANRRAPSRDDTGHNNPQLRRYMFTPQKPPSTRHDARTAPLGVVRGACSVRDHGLTAWSEALAVSALSAEVGQDE